jgi:hypothetical protein
MVNKTIPPPFGCWILEFTEAQDQDGTLGVVFVNG